MLEKRIADMNIREKTEYVLNLMADDEAVKGQAAQVWQLLEKLDDRDMTIAVIGQFKRGKSALSNRILGSDVLPVGIVPITSAVTRVTYGEPKAEIHYLNGVVQPVDFQDLHTYISEQENKDNELGVAEVDIQSQSEFLSHGFAFVDTPGVGSFHKQNTVTAYDHMKEADAVIFLLSVDSPINQIEIDFLKNAREFAARFYFAVNKTDLVSEAELKTYTDYCQALLGQLMDVPGEEIRLYPVSARTGDGVEKLKADIIEECSSHAFSIMEESTGKKLCDVIQSALTQLDFYWTAMNMEYKELDVRFAAIHEKMDEIRRRAESCEGNYNLHLNEYKLELSNKVKELFGMEYHYDIDMLRVGMMEMSKEDFVHETENLVSDLAESFTDFAASILPGRVKNAQKIEIEEY